MAIPIAFSSPHQAVFQGLLVDALQNGLLGMRTGLLGQPIYFDLAAMASDSGFAEYCIYFARLRPDPVPYIAHWQTQCFWTKVRLGRIFEHLLRPSVSFHLQGYEFSEFLPIFPSSIT